MSHTPKGYRIEDGKKYWLLADGASVPIADSSECEDELWAIREKLLAALKRLSSSEAFEAIGVIPSNMWGDELKARMKFADAAIKATERSE